MTTALPEDQRLINLSSKAYEHPADRAATAALQSIPMLDVVVRKLIEFGYERAYRQQFLAASVRLGDDQLPQVWADWNAVCARLDLPERYDIYLTQFPVTNAAAIGAGKPMVVINSRCIDLLDELELRTVLGHEAGHILSAHVLYRTALLILLQLSGAARLPMIAGLPLLAVKLALLEWFRAAELSADRAATLVNRDPLVTSRTLMVMAGGRSSKQLDLEAFLRQAQDYHEWSSTWDRFSRLRNELNQTHSYPVRRVAELTDWVRSGAYDRIIGGTYPRRGDAVDPGEHAEDAYRHYRERFRKAFDEAGEGVSGAVDKMGDWLSGRR
jgi:Zn-dependent protease with chaperone function